MFSSRRSCRSLKYEEAHGLGMHRHRPVVWFLFYDESRLRPAFGSQISIATWAVEVKPTDLLLRLDDAGTSLTIPQPTTADLGGHSTWNGAAVVLRSHFRGPVSRAHL
jgi:hypothetical protein